MHARLPFRQSLGLVGAVVLVIAIASPPVAPPGDLAPTFDADGKVNTDFAAGAEAAQAVAIQGDGKIVVSGSSIVSGATPRDFALARYNTNGFLDPTVDGDGKVTTDFVGGVDEAFTVAIQGDGKIVAAGSADDSGIKFALARYNTDGSLDGAFDGDGRVTTDYAGDDDQAFGVAIQGDGKIVAAGHAVVSNFDFALARYNTNGSLDGAFDGDGKVTTNFAVSGSEDQAFGVAIQTDGKIAAAGAAFVSGSIDFALARYNTDASLDTTFSGDGKVTTDFAGGDDQARWVAIQGDGRIVAAGLAFVSGNQDFALARYTCVRRTSRPMSIPLCS